MKTRTVLIPILVILLQGRVQAQHPNLLFASSDVNAIIGKWNSQSVSFPFLDFKTILNRENWTGTHVPNPNHDAPDYDREKAQWAKVLAFRYMMEQSLLDGDPAYNWLYTQQTGYTLDASYDRWMTDGLALIDYSIAYDLLAGSGYFETKFGGDAAARKADIVRVLWDRAAALYAKASNDITAQYFLDNYITEACNSITFLGWEIFRYCLPVVHEEVLELAKFHSEIGNMRIIVGSALGIAWSSMYHEGSGLPQIVGDPNAFATAYAWFLQGQKDVEHFLLNRKRYQDIPSAFGTLSVQSQNVSGAFPEGLEYLNYSAEGFVPFVIMSKVNGLEDYTQDENLKNILEWSYNVQLPTGAAPQLNSSGNSGVYPVASLFATAISNSSHYLWQLQRYSSISLGGVALPVEGFCLLNDPPTSPAQRQFSNLTLESVQGQAVYRNSTTIPTKYILVSAANGPARYAAGTHGYPNAGSFIFGDGNKLLVRNPGYSGASNYGDFRKAISHSTVCPVVNYAIAYDETWGLFDLPPCTDAAITSTTTTNDFSLTNESMELNGLNQELDGTLYSGLATLSINKDIPFEYISSAWYSSQVNKMTYGNCTRSFLMVNNSYLIVRDEITKTSPSLQYAVSLIQGNNGNRSEINWQLGAESTGDGDEVRWNSNADPSTNGSGPILRVNTAAVGGKVGQFSAFEKAMHQNETTRDITYHAAYRTACSFINNYGQILSLIESDQSVSSKSSQLTKRSIDGSGYTLYTIDGRGRTYGRYDVLLSKQASGLQTIAIGDLPSPILTDARFLVMSFPNDFNDPNGIKIFCSGATFISYSNWVFVPNQSGESQTSFTLRTRLTSSTQDPTALSNQRKVSTLGSSTHVVYSSDGSIWYTRKDGSTFSPEVRIRASSSARNPSITTTYPGGQVNVHLAWEEDGDYGYHNVYYRRSTDNGSSWESPILLSWFPSAFPVSNQDATPVVAGSTAPVVVVFRYGDGSWGGLAMRAEPAVNTNTYSISGTNGTSRLPSLVYGRLANNTEGFNLAFEQSSAIQFKEFVVRPSAPFDITYEASLVQVASGNGCTNPSIATSPGANSSVFVAWDASASGGRHVFVRERTTSSSWLGTMELTLGFNVDSNPVVGIDDNQSTVSVVWTSNGTIVRAQKTLSSSFWGTPMNAGSGNAPSLLDRALSGQSPYGIWTSGTSAPYTINLSPFVQSIAGTISNNTTWSGTYNVTGPVTVNSGASLTITPGSTIIFAGGISLTSYGVLSAVGTSSNRITFTSSSTSPGSWGSIVLDGYGTLGSSLTYMTMRYGTEIRCNNAPDFSISNSTIENTINGINAWGSTGTVANNLFNLQRDHGVIVSNSTIGTQYNTITKTDNSGAALLYNENSNSWGNYVFHNDIYGYNWGVASSYGASIHFGDQNAGYHPVNNRIRNCLYGLMVYSYAQIDLCDNYNGYLNSIRNNVCYHAYVYNNSTVFAAFNYWGNPVNWNQFYVGSASYLDNGDELSYDPWPDGSGGTRIADIGLQAISDQNGAKQSSQQDTQSWIKEGRKLRRQGNLSGAFDCFKNALSNNESPTEALLGIASLYGSNLDRDVEGVLSSLPKNRFPLSAYLHAGILSRQGKNDDAILELSRIQEDSDLGRASKYLRFHIVLNNKKDKEQAETILNSLGTRGDNDIEYALAQHDLLSFLGSEMPAAEFEKYSSDTRPAIPTNFECFQNYPNPFNPVTTIQYQLPVNGNVSLKVYDILGQEVADLVNEQKGPGIYAVQWDASKLPSGIYLSHFSVLSENGKQFAKVVKMALLK
ncbi:MAG: T9SS type A sorting domain-containing protein [Bacteroidota bacterium]